MRDRGQDKTQSRRRRQYTCPICKRRVTVSQGDPARLPAFFPFCSERCKLIDLGAWLDAGYRIPAKPDEESEHPPDPGSATETQEAQKPHR